MTVHRLLVTAHPDHRVAVWAATAMCANWIECRDHPAKDGSETCLVIVFGEDLAGVVDVARQVSEAFGPVTVQEIHGSGDGETYTLLLGAPGTGWPDKELPAAIADHHRAAAAQDTTLVARLAQELNLPDD